MTDESRDDRADFPPDPDPYRGEGEDRRPPPAPENLPPWEDRANFSLIAGFFNTIPRAMTAPGRFFTDHPVRRGLWGPITFGVLMGFLVSLAEWLWSRATSDFEDTLLQLLGEDYEITPLEDSIVTFIESFGVLVSPLLALVALFVLAGAVHLGVMLMSSGRQRGFEATLRAVAYANAATILAVVPMCGSLIGLVWMLVIAVIGVRQMHGIGTAPALFAVTAPAVLCCCGLSGATFLIAQLAAL